MAAAINVALIDAIRATEHFNLAVGKNPQQFGGANDEGASDWQTLPLKVISGAKLHGFMDIRHHFSWC